MRLTGIAWTIAALAVLLAGPARAGIYRWTDAQGQIHFAQSLADVPPQARAAAQAAAEHPQEEPSRFQTYASPEPSRPAPSQSFAAGQVLHIPFQHRGNGMLVQVRVNDRVTAPFLVDTGASDVTLPAAVAQQAGILVDQGTPRALYHTANGTISEPVVTIDSLQAGDARVEGLRGSVSSSMKVGLLGGTFFNNFTFQVDPAADVISLVPNPRVRGSLSEAEWRTRFRALRTRLAEIDAYMAQNHFTSKDRIADLKRHRTAVAQQLAQLERQADLAEVPQNWRE